ncbi:MAG: hypothetical protein ACJA04_000358 [Cellvibrionaceae bacterium]|jgi:hypothetical protein
MAAAILYFRKALWPLVVALIALLVLLIDVAIFMPALLFDAFNPVSTNLAGAALTGVALRNAKMSKCKRQYEEQGYTKVVEAK